MVGSLPQEVLAIRWRGTRTVEFYFGNDAQPLICTIYVLINFYIFSGTLICLSETQYLGQVREPTSSCYKSEIPKLHVAIPAIYSN